MWDSVQANRVSWLLGVQEGSVRSSRWGDCCTTGQIAGTSSERQLQPTRVRHLDDKQDVRSVDCRRLKDFRRLTVALLAGGIG